MKKNNETLGENIINVNVGTSNKKEPGKFAKIISSSEEVASWIADTKWQRIVKVYLVLVVFLITILGGIFFYKITSDEDAMHKAAMRIATIEKQENLREEVITPKIQKNLDAILYTLNADRAYLIEFHNGKKNTTGLPFRYMDVSYEVTNQESKATKIGMFYQNIPTTLYKFPYYLIEHRYYIGTIDDFKAIDADLGKQMEANFSKYFAVIALNSDGTPLGYLGISWCDVENVPDVNVIKSKLHSYDKTFSQLLDLRIQMTIN